MGALGLGCCSIVTTLERDTIVLDSERDFTSLAITFLVCYNLTDVLINE